MVREQVFVEPEALDYPETLVQLTDMLGRHVEVTLRGSYNSPPIFLDLSVKSCAVDEGPQSTALHPTRPVSHWLVTTPAGFRSVTWTLKAPRARLPRNLPLTLKSSLNEPSEVLVLVHVSLAEPAVRRMPVRPVKSVPGV